VSVRVTVAIATCGRPEALARCLEAIAAQSRPPDQLIVVDQNPSPEVRDVIDASGVAVDYREQERLGLSASRNLALASAQGGVLAVTDDDCIPDADWTAAIAEAFEAAVPPTGLTGPILAPPGAPPAAMHAISLRTSRDTRDFNERAIPWYVGSGGNFAASIEKLRAIGGWDTRLGAGSPGMAAEDCDLIDRLLRARELIRYDGKAVVRHDWQTRERRKATRWSYGYGIGALCGLRLASGDSFAWRMMGSYGWMHVRDFVKEIARRNWTEAGDRIIALAGLLPGCIYGLRVSGERGDSAMSSKSESGRP
jgi:GT2 family glycosyltransferase